MSAGEEKRLNRTPEQNSRNSDAECANQQDCRNRDAEYSSQQDCPLVSVIVPVYNRSKTLARCMDSILAQSYRNLEIIAVDDGSTDDSKAQLLKYAGKDPRVVLISKPNSGVSDSRNYALESAHGMFVQFVDSDDWIAENATAEYVRAITENESDLVISDYYRIRGRQIHQSGDIREAGTYTRTEYAEQILDKAGDFYYGVVWNKFFRRSIIEAHRLSFDERMDWCEDFLFNLEYLRYASLITVLKDPLYFYVKTKGSLVNTKTTPANVIKTKLKLYEYYKELYRSMDLYEKNRLKIQLFLLQSAADRKKRLDRDTYLEVTEKYPLRTPEEMPQEMLPLMEKLAAYTKKRKGES